MTDLRHCGVNEHCWYVAARSDEVKERPKRIVVWKQAIALYRDQDNQVHAIEDRCLHRQVPLKLGESG